MRFPSLKLSDIIDAIKSYFKGKKKEYLEEDRKAKDRAKMLLNYYGGDQEYDLKGWGFEDADLGDDLIPKTCINITKKIIDKVSMVYKYPPTRILVNQEGEEIKEKDEYQRWVNYVETFDNYISEAEKQKNLFHKVLWRNHFNRVTQKWQFFVEWDYKAHFVGNDPLNPVGYSIPVSIPNENLDRDHKVGESEQIYLYYDDKNYFYYNTKGEYWTYFTNDDGVRSDNNGENIYGVSPFIELRRGVPVYQYETNGALDLVAANRAVNINLTNLNMAIHYQAFGVLWDDSGIDKEAGNQILVGPNRQAHVEKGVTVNNLDLNPKLMEMIETVKFEVQAISNIYNLTVNWHNEATPVSGFSLIVQNMDYIEQRQKDVDEAKKQEREIYRSIKAIQEVHKTDLKKDEPRLPQNAFLNIDFQELDLPVNQMEDREQEQHELENNIISVLDAIKRRNPDMDDEAAEEKLQRNKEINGRLTSAEKTRQTLEQRGITFE